VAVADCLLGVVHEERSDLVAGSTPILIKHYLGPARSLPNARAESRLHLLRAHQRRGGV
jgi:hypothetical protein